MMPARLADKIEKHVKSDAHFYETHISISKEDAMEVVKLIRRLVDRLEAAKRVSVGKVVIRLPDGKEPARLATQVEMENMRPVTDRVEYDKPKGKQRAEGVFECAGCGASVLESDLKLTPDDRRWVCRGCYMKGPGDHHWRRL